MDGIEGLLARDFGVRPQGKAAPMAGASSRSTGSGASTAAWSSYGRSTPAPAPASTASFDSLFDSFNGPTTKPAAPSPSPAPAYDDDIFGTVPVPTIGAASMHRPRRWCRPSHRGGSRSKDAEPHRGHRARLRSTTNRAPRRPPPTIRDPLSSSRDRACRQSRRRRSTVLETEAPNAPVTRERRLKPDLQE